MAIDGRTLYETAKPLIPGGSQLLTKKPERNLPDYWPSYYESARGNIITGLDGVKYTDVSYMGVGSAVLGYGHPEVDDRVRDAVSQGTMTTLNAPEEVELARVLIELHPWADMVRYARTGGEAVAIAVRIARAHTGREDVAFCGYHGWHDWYLAANLGGEDALGDHLLPGLSPNGVPQSLAGTAHPFHYNELDELKAIVQSHDLAAIVMEPIRNYEPEGGFLTGVRELSRSHGVPLVFDEVSAGFRIRVGGAHKAYDVEPDLAVFAKALGNGYPMAAVIGSSEVMSAAGQTFISSTYWSERIGPVAALATIEVFRNQNVIEHLSEIGRLVQQGWKDAAEAAGLPIEVTGIPPLSHFEIQVDGAEAAHTLFTQHLLEENYLASNSFYVSLVHTREGVEEYLRVAERAFARIAQAATDGRVEDELRGPIRESEAERLA